MGGSRVSVIRPGSPEANLSLVGYVPMAPEPGGTAVSPAPQTAKPVRSDAPVADSAAPFKRVRRRHSQASAEAKVSMFGLRDLWLMPFLAEVVLMFGAVWMSFCLLRVVQDPKAGFPLGSVLVLAAAYVGLAIYSRLHELFLPRKVVFLGVGGLLLLSVAVMTIAMADAYLMGGRGRLVQAALVLTPAHLFVLRCLLIFREARFTPAAHSLQMRLKCRGEKIDELRRKLRFWMS